MSPNNRLSSFFYHLGRAYGKIFGPAKPKQPVYTEPRFAHTTCPRLLEEFLGAQLISLLNIIDYADSFIDDRELADEIQEQGFMLHSNSVDEAKDYFEAFADIDDGELCSINLKEIEDFARQLRQPFADLAEKLEEDEKAEKFRTALDSVLFTLEQMPLPTIEVLVGKVQHV